MLKILGLDISYAQVLLLLVMALFFLIVMRRLSALEAGKRREKGEEPLPALVTPAPSEDEGELVAVLTAAAAMMMGTEPRNVKIASFSRVDTSAKAASRRSAWAQAGRLSQFTKPY